MNTKNLTILTILTIVIVIVAALITQPQTVTIKPEKFFPNLAPIINDVTEIHVSTKDETISMVRGENGQWQLKEKDNYPVDLGKVRKLLLGAINLTILEAKTKNPALYSKIEVEDISEKDAKSTLLTLKKAEDNTVASVIIGKDRIARIDSSRKEIYVRKPTEKRSWLVLGQLPIATKKSDWLDKQIVNINNDNIRQVSINHPDGDSFVFFKNTPKDEEYQFADLPANAKVKSPYILNGIATSLNNLDFDDVIKAGDIEFDDKTTTRGKFTTFDGLEVSITTIEKDGKYYAKFSAAFNQAAVLVSTPDDKSEPKSEPKKADEKVDEKATEKSKVDAAPAPKKAETLNAKFKGWVYELSKYKVDYLEKRRDDLISVTEKPAEPESVEKTEDKPVEPESVGVEKTEDKPAEPESPTTTKPTP